jgi:hypothetical protein
MVLSEALGQLALRFGDVPRARAHQQRAARHRSEVQRVRLR